MKKYLDDDYICTPGVDQYFKEQLFSGRSVLDTLFTRHDFLENSGQNLP